MSIAEAKTLPKKDTRNDKYVVLWDDFNEVHVEFLDTKEELYVLLSKLCDQKTPVTNQSVLEFTRVFNKGALYPMEYHAFQAYRKRPERKTYNLMSPWFVQRRMKTGRLKQRYYDWAESFDSDLEDWSNFDPNLIVLDCESLSGDYIYNRDIKQVWGDKGFIFDK